MSSWDQENRGEKLGVVWRKRKKISQIIDDYCTFTYRSSLLIILWFQAMQAGLVQPEATFLFTSLVGYCIF
jgi:hypothetical protein